MQALGQPGGAGQSAHRGGGPGAPRAGAARAAHPAAGAVGRVGKHACLHARGSAAAPLGTMKSLTLRKAGTDDSDFAYYVEGAGFTEYVERSRAGMGISSSRA